ncbi:polysaccharide pyruvyl transferase family protein [Hyalangium rubrum]|uniref:Polysaccharide pyruvyl transferase family protein n=1 Tax=Hyalangium rubrum TaxID=3103134 RepID=A0ABU5HB08_9BACT|nr:polysaccharide pyruvyl transferase family protein [Hyalangium sp. s54d21]MDY7230446.1 polysaccharide pyruvyl transferase family protein [Hyalangium sp. s54d21]
MIKFGLSCYRNTRNLGDEIQSLAARQFLPRVDHFIDRDFLADFVPGDEQPVALILNGWFAHRAENWPPVESIIPLPVSMHLSSFRGWGPAGISAEQFFLHPSAREYLEKWGPVGARDLHTLQLLKKAEVPAYFSGCLTLTLKRKPEAVREDFIAAVDLPAEIVEALRKRTDRPILTLTHDDTVTADVSERFTKAERLLDAYQRAHCVVTTRLHCALPCLAFETPVLLLDQSPDQTRFAGLHQLLRHSSPEAFLEGKGFPFDLQNPEPNDLDYLKLRNELTSRVEQFISDVSSERITPEALSDGGSLLARYNTLWAFYTELRKLREVTSAELEKARNEVQEQARTIERLTRELEAARAR